MKTENNNRKTLLWIGKRTKKFIWPIILITTIDAVIALAGVSLALISKEVLDHSNQNKLVLFGALLIGVVLLNQILKGISSAVLVRVFGKMTISMRNYLFTQIVRKKYPKISTHHSGDLLNRCTSDVDVIVSGVTDVIPNFISMLTKIIAGLSALFVLNTKLAILVLVIGIAVPTLGRQLSKRYKYLHKEAQRTEGQARSFMQESFANLVVVKTFGSEKPLLKKLNEFMSNNLKIKIRRNFVSVIISFFLNSFFSLGYYGVLLWGASHLGTTITYGTLNAYLQLISQLQMPLRNVSAIIPQYYSTMASAERLIDLENIADEEPALQDDRFEALKKDFKTLEIDHVAFAYDDELILKNCSFTVEKNRITALTGESGCGKSTLFRLILGLYEPSGGSITFNGNIPVGPATRGMFAYVPQGNMILSGTIRENITMCNENISDEEIENATRAADIYDLIMSLENGFDTVLSERGGGLSEGQIQRISIARALLFDTPILLLDEATSALDEATETTVLSNIKKMTDKTVLFITHRNTSISVCDHIVHAQDKKFEVIR